MNHAIALFDSLVFPRLCPLCARPLWPGAAGWGRGGLCPACQSSLIPTSGLVCKRCGKPLISELGLCMTCRDRDLPFEAAHSLFSYRDKAAALIGAYKFAGRLSLAAYLAPLVAEHLSATWPGLPVVPVPYRRAKIVEKGFDQVEVLAKALGRRGFRVLHLLERLPSGEQKRLDLEGRRENALRAYRLKAGLAVPEALILLDDVFTTGATASACASALRSGGAKRVFFLALAAD